MTLRDLLTEGEHALQSAGIEDWKMDAWYLMEEMLHVSRTRYLMEPSKEVHGTGFSGVRRCAGT